MGWGRRCNRKGRQEEVDAYHVAQWLYLQQYKAARLSSHIGNFNHTAGSAHKYTLMAIHANTCHLKWSDEYKTQEL